MDRRLSQVTLANTNDERSLGPLALLKEITAMLLNAVAFGQVGKIVFSHAKCFSKLSIERVKNFLRLIMKYTEKLRFKNRLFLKPQFNYESWKV